jgi:hypothetical protein
VFFMFILVPCHKSCESVKIGPHPEVTPHHMVSELLVATDLLSFVISTINFENKKNSPKIASNFDLKIC